MTDLKLRAHTILRSFWVKYKCGCAHVTIHSHTRTLKSSSLFRARTGLSMKRISVCFAILGSSILNDSLYNIYLICKPYKPNRTNKKLYSRTKENKRAIAKREGYFMCVCVYNRINASKVNEMDALDSDFSTKHVLFG